MENIKASLMILVSVEKHREALDLFARDKYYERFPRTEVQQGTYHSYSSFDIISNDEIRVNYVYGGGDMDFTGNFTIKI